MHPTPYLFFNGTCRAAFDLYVDVFGGKIDMMMTYGDLPPSEDMTVPDDKEDWIMHAGIQWPDGGMLMASDNLHGDQPQMEGNSISMALPTTEAGRVAFERLSEGGDVGMPYQAMFWSPGFGTVRDKFGTRWMITTSEQA